MEITSRDGYLHFEIGDYAREVEHLPRSRDEKAELEQEVVRELKAPNGLSYREIADKLGTSCTTVSRIAKNRNLMRNNGKSE